MTEGYRRRLSVAWLVLGPHAVVSHRSAALLHGLMPDPEPGATGTRPIELWVSRHTPAYPQKPWRLHRLPAGQAALPAIDVTEHLGSLVMVTSVARTVVDLSTLGLPDQVLHTAVQQAVAAGVTPRDILERSDARPGVGCCRYPGERQLLRVLAAAHDS
jgi:hypothetical protein